MLKYSNHFQHLILMIENGKFGHLTRRNQIFEGLGGKLFLLALPV